MASSSSVDPTEEEQEAFYAKMDEMFGPVNGKAPETREEKEAVAVKRRRTVSTEETSREVKQKKGSAGATVSGGIAASEKDEVPVVQRGPEATNIMPPAEQLVPIPTPEAEIPLVPRLSVDSSLQQTFPTACTIRSASSSTPAAPQHLVNNYFGTVNHFHNPNADATKIMEKPAIQQNEADGRMFTILNIKVENHQTCAIAAIVQLLGHHNVHITPADVTLIGTLHGMPRLHCKRFSGHFSLPPEHAAAVVAVLNDGQLSTGADERLIEIRKRMKYKELLERELLLMGQKMLSQRLAPVPVRIEGRTLVYHPRELPTKRVTVSVNELLADEEFLTDARNKLNRPARITIRDLIQE